MNATAGVLLVQDAYYEDHPQKDPRCPVQDIRFDGLGIVARTDFKFTFQVGDNVLLMIFLLL